MKLNDEQHTTLKELVDVTLRELVFMDHHREDEQYDEMLDALTTIENNLSFYKEICDAAAATIRDPGPVCKKCKDTGIITYGVGQKLECECTNSPIRAINDAGRIS